jgi:hypothetical protein
LGSLADEIVLDGGMNRTKGRTTMAIDDCTSPLGISRDMEATDFGRTVAGLATADCSPAVDRLVSEGVPKETAYALREEFLRFIAVRELVDGPIAPAKPVDDFWHAFILETPAYAAFCDEHFGEFVHHFHDDAYPVTYAQTAAVVRSTFPGASPSIWSEEGVPCSGSSGR